MTNCPTDCPFAMPETRTGHAAEHAILAKAMSDVREQVASLKGWIAGASVVTTGLGALLGFFIHK